MKLAQYCTGGSAPSSALDRNSSDSQVYLNCRLSSLHTVCSELNCIRKSRMLKTLAVDMRRRPDIAGTSVCYMYMACAKSTMSIAHIDMSGREVPRCCRCSPSTSKSFTRE
jgi:hypothetical protein